MALLTAWLGLPGALLAFVIGVVLGAAFALAMLDRPGRTTRSRGRAQAAARHISLNWRNLQRLWGQQILTAYLRWAGLL